MIKILEIFNFWDMLDFGQLRCLLELGGFPYLSEFEQTSEMRNSQGTRGTREPPGFLQAAPLRCFFFLPPFYIAGPLYIYQTFQPSQLGIGGAGVSSNFT